MFSCKNLVLVLNVRMVVAPIPVLILPRAILLRIVTIGFMVFLKVLVVGAIFVVVPIVVILVRAIVDALLLVGALWPQKESEAGAGRLATSQ